MRLLLVAALVAAAFAARESHKWNKEVLSETFERVGSFKSGYEYRFNLEAQVSNGLSVPGSQQAAVRSKSLITLAFPESDTFAHLRIEKIHLGSLQKEIEQPKDVQPFEIFDDIEISEENFDLLRLPVAFRYEHGIVSEIEFDRNDVEWSKNIKRVYLNMLQVNLSQKNAVESSRLYSGKEAVFSAPEVTLEGECEVTYSVLPAESRRESDEAELFVTKSLNFNKCSRRVGQKAVMPVGDKKEEEKREKMEGEEKEIESSTVLNYKILGTVSRFLIKEVELRSVYVYSPLSEDNSIFTTFASGKLTLLEVAKEDKRIPAPKCDKKESLLHSTEWNKKLYQFLATGEESLLEGFPYPEMKNKHEVVVKLIKSVVASMESEEKGIDLSANHDMRRAVNVLRLCTKEHIKKMHKELCEKDEQTKAVFLDALALAGSLNTVEHLVEKIRSREVSPMRASSLLKQITAVPAPSEKMIHSLTSLCKDVKHAPVDRQSCWLTVGVLMNKLCGDQLAVLDDRRVCSRDLKKDYVRELMEQFERAETRYEKILALKTMGNSGMDLIVFPLEKIIRDVKEEQVVRVQAVEALRKLGSVMPRKIVSVLMPVYKNVHEKPELRVAAFRVMIQSFPGKAVIDIIVDHLRIEPSTQVFAHIYEVLSQIAESEIPHEKRAGEHIKAALKNIRPRASRKLSSAYKYFSTFNDDVKSGATLNWAALFGDDSVLPKELRSSFKTSLAGKMAKHQIAFSQHNIEKKLYNLLEKVDRAALEDVIVRGKRSSYKPSEILRDLFRDLSISRREQSEDNANALLYVRIDDNDYALLPIDEEVFPEMIKQATRNGKFDVSEIKSVLAKGIRFSAVHVSMVYDHHRTLVHSLGMPLAYTTQMPTIFKVEGEIKAEIVSNGKSLEGLRLFVKAQPTIAATHVTQVEIMNPLVNYGVKLLHSIQANLPIDMTTELSWKEDEDYTVKTTLALPKESRRLAQLSTRPVSFVRTWPKETRVYVQPKESTIYLSQLESEVHRIEESLFEKATGIKVNVEGHYHGHIFRQSERGLPHALLVGENNVEITFERTAQTPKEYVMRTEVGLFEEKQKMENPKWERLVDSEYDDEENYESGRRQEAERYTKEYRSERGYAHRLFSQIKSVGGRKEHKAEIELKSMCDEKMRHCTVALNGRTTPLLEKETREWTIESDMQLLYPAVPETLAKLLSQKHREVTLAINARWGSDNKNEMTLKIQGEQNKEQKQWLKKVAELSEEADLTPMEEYYRLVEAAMLNDYKLVAKYDCQPVYKNIVARLFDLVKVQTPILSTVFTAGHEQKNVVRAQLTFEPLMARYVNLTVATPTEKMIVDNMRIFSALPLLNIRRQSSSPIRSLSHIGSALIDETRAECTVESGRIRSFDDVIYRTPLTTCYSVLAKDCSSSQPAFAVLIKKVEKKGEEKKVKIITKEAVVELEISKRGLRVLIDGEVESKVERLEKAGIYKNGDIVIVEMEDLTVEFDGFTANVKMSEYYKNKQCGICGHFDGEKKTEFRRADNEDTEDIESFHRSFLVKGKECEIEEDRLSEKRNYGIESEEEEQKEEQWESEESRFESKWNKKSSKKSEWSSSSEETVEPVKKTRVIETSHRVCFSMEAVPECPKHATEDEKNMKEIKVAFACLSRSDRDAARLVREARREIVNVDSFDETYKETLFVPRTCTVY